MITKRKSADYDEALRCGGLCGLPTLASEAVVPGFRAVVGFGCGGAVRVVVLLVFGQDLTRVGFAEDEEWSRTSRRRVSMALSQ